MTDQISEQGLALSIIDFLNKSAQQGKLDSDDVAVATDIIQKAFNAEGEVASHEKSLLEIYQDYENSKTTPASPEVNAKAEKHKNKGNAAMKQSPPDHAAAAEHYNNAINLNPQNAVYWSNRAAAYSVGGNHEDALVDAEQSVKLDPSFVRGWSRVGFSKAKLGDAKGSLEAYKTAMALEGDKPSEAIKNGYDNAKKTLMSQGETVDDDGPTSSSSPAAPSGLGAMPGLSEIASMLGASGADGKPDFNKLQENPMLKNFAKSFANNPNMIGDLMKGMGGNMPDMSKLMQSPEVANLAASLMGGGKKPSSDTPPSPPSS